MYKGHTVIAIVPARSGSKGLPNKNMMKLQGVSLIGRVGQCLMSLDWLDVRILSTDSLEYAKEGERFGLSAPFLRPDYLSGDQATAVDTVLHGLNACEASMNKIFDIVLIVEPTSPIRSPEDIEETVNLLIDKQYDSVVTVSTIDTKYHPGKVLNFEDNLLSFYEGRGSKIVARQELETLYYRNGVCYALNKESFIKYNQIFMPKTAGHLIQHPVANIDNDLDFKWAEFLISL